MMETGARTRFAWLVNFIDNPEHFQTNVIFRCNTAWSHGQLRSVGQSIASESLIEIVQRFSIVNQRCLNFTQMVLIFTL